MPQLDVGGVAINYIVQGEGPPVVLIHGFAGNLHGFWRAPGMVDALAAAGRRVVALDCRGHGRSGKPHDPAAYEDNAMAEDVIALMDHLGFDKADLMGYSMGGILSAGLLVRHPDRFRTVILAGIGDMILGGGLPDDRSEAMARAMETKDASTVDNDVARAFRLFAERSGNDLEALAAMQRARRGSFDAGALRNVSLPVMVVIGDGDTLASSADKLVDAIPGAVLAKVPGDHLTALAAPAYRIAVVEFLARHSPVPA